MAAGPDGMRQAGTTHDLPEDEAKRLIEAGAAVELYGREYEPRIPLEAALLQTRDPLCEPPGGITLVQAMKNMDSPYNLQSKYAVISEASKDSVWREIYDEFVSLNQAGDKRVALGRPGYREASYEAIPASALPTLRPLVRA